MTGNFNADTHVGYSVDERLTSNRQGGRIVKLVTGMTAGIIVVALAGPGISLAQPPTLAEAKKAGFPAKNCQYCHTEALPKKDTFKADTSLNDRGKFLLSDMQKRSLKAPDVQVLKQFSEKQ